MARGRSRRRRGDRAHAVPETYLRIIGGAWRSRVLTVADRPGLRPTPNRVRETLFNWLAPRIEGATCIDLFAGTGALGVEALSRGAASAVFVERDRVAAAAIGAALTKLNATDRASVIAGDATDAARLIGGPPADVVFVDPPFDAELHATALAGARSLLHARSRLYLEYPATLESEIFEMLGGNYEILRHARSAGVGYCLARIRSAGDHDCHD